jgi:ABC-type amino acid transport substrate-binding protein
VKFKNLLLSGCQQIAGCGAIFAIASPKGSGLAQAYEAAIKRLIANGTYKRIFDKWGMEGNILPASQVKVDGSHAQLPG